MIWMGGFYYINKFESHIVCQSKCFEGIMSNPADCVSEKKHYIKKYEVSYTVEHV